MVGNTEGRVIKWKGDVPLPPIPNCNFTSMMLEVFATYGDRVALVDGQTNKYYTYKNLCRIIPSMHSGLSAAGLKQGDRILLVSRNHIDIPPVILAIMSLGAACVPLNPASTKEEIKHIIKISEARWAVVSEKEAPKLKEAFKELGPDLLMKIWVIGKASATLSSVADLMQSNSTWPNEEDKSFDASTTVALMPFSSGTTGLPKGVMLSHRNLVASKCQRKFILDFRPGARKNNLYQSVLIVLPMYHIFAYNQTMFTLFTGGKSIILNKFNIRDYFQAIQRHQVTFAPVVPYMIRILGDSPLIKEYDLSSLRAFVTGSEPVSTNTLEKLMKRSGRMVSQGYAMTESTGLGAATSPGDPTEGNFIGKFGPFFQVKVVDRATGEPLHEGVDGELCLKGPLVMQGYVNNPEATAETIDPEGWLHTGDLAHFDENDNFYITGRIKDLIKVKGYQVAPAELENIIKTIEGVSEVAVAGVPQRSYGEVPRAWIVPQEGVTIDTDAIMRHVAGHVAPYKRLTGGVEVVRSLPKNHIGKVMRRRLREKFETRKSKL